MDHPAVVGAVAFLVGFAVAFAGWRWGLGSENWLEGAIIATVFGGVVAAVAFSLADVRRRYVERRDAVSTVPVTERATCFDG